MSKSICVLTLFVVASPVFADNAVTSPVELAGRIDRHLAARWAAARIRPMPPADDATFLRRVFLDIVGVIPPAHVARDFHDDRAPDKRAKLIDRLMRSPRYVSHFTNFWRAALLPENPNGDNLGLRQSFEAWLQVRLSQNAGYDRMAREILMTGQQRNRRGELPVMDVGGGVSPAAFDQANESKPENLAGSTARLFLAVKLECAQCHNHPHAEWTQEQFWAYAAFFGGIRTNNTVTINLPKGGKKVPARFPSGQEPTFDRAVNPRAVLAEWVTSAHNPYFAKATVNRLWAHFFGSGLVEPIDDLTQIAEKDPLLEDLAREFIASRFDLKFLIRAIVESKAYQLASHGGSENSDELRQFARMPVRALTAEQIYDSLLEVMRLPPDTGTGRLEFQARFQRQNEKATEAQTSILQALSLMNGKLVEDATSLERSETLTAIAGAPYLDAAGKVDALFQAVLARFPRPTERERFVSHVQKGGPTGDAHRALADVFWVLLNSGEFLFNH